MRVWDIWEFEKKYATKYGNMGIMGILRKKKYATKYGNMGIMGIMGNMGSMGQMDTLERVCFGTIVVL